MQCILTNSGQKRTPTAYCNAGNVGLLLCWPALALCVLCALGVEKLGICHIQLEKKVWLHATWAHHQGCWPADSTSAS